jgi:hypothetical protein
VTDARADRSSFELPARYERHQRADKEVALAGRRRVAGQTGAGRNFLQRGDAGGGTYGIDGAPTGAHKRALEVWFGETFVSWPERIIPVGFEIVQAWGGPLFNPWP